MINYFPQNTNKSKKNKRMDEQLEFLTKNMGHIHPKKLWQTRKKIQRSSYQEFSVILLSFRNKYQKCVLDTYQNRTENLHVLFRMHLNSAAPEILDESFMTLMFLRMFINIFYIYKFIFQVHLKTACKIKEIFCKIVYLLSVFQCMFIFNIVRHR